MGYRYEKWAARSQRNPRQLEELKEILLENRNFQPLEKLHYGDHGLEAAIRAISAAIDKGQRIALYADYDVDGTMSCVSWIWFLRAIKFDNFVHYIPCRFKEGYGVNLDAVKHLIHDEKASLIITMDTGITANEEAKYCRAQGVEFICTDHHKIQPEKMPDTIILNPKQHPDEMYQELCGCGITFVLLRQLATKYAVPDTLWNDLLSLVGMATICDVVPLNPVNHSLARKGVAAITRSHRPVIRKLKDAALTQGKVDEADVGFRLGPRINAVGRLGHADQVVEAFVTEDPTPLIRHMEECNQERKQIQKNIVDEAMKLAEEHKADPILFLGGDWHTGVVGIAASKVAERFWKPTWLFQRKEGIGKGSARSIFGFDVTDAMGAAKHLFTKFGGHRAAGGFSFDLKHESEIRATLLEHANQIQEAQPEIWQTRIDYDCPLPFSLAELPLLDALDSLKPFGNGFEEPRFSIEGEIKKVQFYNDKTTGEPKHTMIQVGNEGSPARKIMFFNEVLEDLTQTQKARFIVTATRNRFRGIASIEFFGYDYAPLT